MFILEGLAIIIGCVALLFLFLIVYIAYKDFIRILRRNRPIYPNDHICEATLPIPSYHESAIDSRDLIPRVIHSATKAVRISSTFSVLRPTDFTST